MKKLLLLVFLLPLQLLAQPFREVIGYYAGWQWYDRNKLMSPETVPYEKYTILTYAFFQPQADGTVRISDPWGDKNQLLGPINWAVAPSGYDTQYDFGNPNYHQNGKKLSDYAHQKNCKLMVSIGGWTYSAHFPGIAADADKRSVFAGECRKMVEIYGLDGIDIDWEYPANATEKAGLTTLLQQVRDTLDALETRLQKQLILSIAAGAGPDHIAQVDWASIKNIVDIVNLMSYDFYGTWDKNTNHNAPLYPKPGATQTGFSCAEAVNNVLATGFPADKLTMGLAWYGRSQMTTGSPGLFQNGTGQADLTHFAADEGTPLFYNIKLKMTNFDEHWDSISRVPYLTGKISNSFVSFDNEQSITEKAAFIVSKQLKGAIIWEISGDYIESTSAPGTIASTPLTDAMNAEFCRKPGGVSIQQLQKIKVYPNPAGSSIYLNSDLHHVEIEYTIIDVKGVPCYGGQIQDSGQVIELGGLPSGIYFLKVKSEKGTETCRFIRQ